MSEHPPLSDEQRAELVAYLDGELDEAAARALEARLGHDPALRAEADALRRTWDLLDFLPVTEPSPDFTHRTLTRVISQSGPAVRTGLQPRPGAAVRRLLWGAGALAAAAAGFAAVVLLGPRRPTDAELARDLRLLENRRLYEHVDSLEFLRQLAHPDLFGEDGEGGG